MKKSFTVIAGLAFSSILMMSSCTYTNDKKPAAEQLGPEYTSTYVCPMHCEGSGSETAGTCPVCNMDYVLNEKK